MRGCCCVELNIFNAACCALASCVLASGVAVDVAEANAACLKLLSSEIGHPWTIISIKSIARGSSRLLVGDLFRDLSRRTTNVGNSKYFTRNIARRRSS